MSATPQAAGLERAAADKFILHKTIVLVGMMGSGKTSVGRALAARLGVPLLDSDAEIELAANATISEIFARDGEPFFRARESEVIERLLAGSPCVLSTGGGAFLAERNRTAISAQGVSVSLCAELDLLWDRVRQKETRPLLRTADPKRTLAELCAMREPFYAMADLKVHTLPHYSIDETTDKLIEALLSRPDILERA